MTMMTTMTMNNPEVLTTPTESECVQIGSEELSLGDNHLDFIEEAERAMPLTASAPLSIPAMLCDDKLLEEINAIPDKMGFKIGDVAEILGIKQYVLRYWETEFDILRPKKASNNQRMYTRKDVENALLIRKLLHRDRFSIEGARNAMKELKAHVRKEKDMSVVIHKLDNMNDSVEALINDIRRIRHMFD